MEKTDRKLRQDVHKIVDEHYRSSDSGDRYETKVYIRTDKNRIKLPDNVMVFQAFAYLASTKLNASTNRILMFFFALQAYENLLGIDIATICEELNLSKPTVTKALKDLEKHNIIIKTQSLIDKRRHEYFTNPVAAWKGNSLARQKMLQKLPKSQLELFPKEI